MRLALKGKNKLKFIDRSILKLDEDDPNFSTWDSCNTYVVSWMNHSLSPKIDQSVVWNEIAYELQDDLKRRYYQGDVFRIA